MLEEGWLNPNQLLEEVGGSKHDFEDKKLGRAAPYGVYVQIPVHRGQSFRRIADSVPVIADSF